MTSTRKCGHCGSFDTQPLGAHLNCLSCGETSLDSSPTNEPLVRTGNVLSPVPDEPAKKSKR